MHDKYCKCMDCAKARYNEADARARRYDRETWNHLTEAVDNAVDAHFAAEKKLNEALNDRRDFIIEHME